MEITVSNEKKLEQRGNALGDAVPPVEPRLESSQHNRIAPRKRGIRLLTLHELYAATSETVPWLVDGLFREGSHGVIGAAPKTGKTMTALALMHALATGTAFLGQFPTQKKRVALIEEDDPSWRIAERLQALERGYGANMDSECVRVASQCRVRLDVPILRQALVNELQAFRPEVIILDPLARFHALKEQDAQEMGRLIVLLDEVATALAPCSIIVVHHLRKPKEGAGGNGGVELRGSSVFHAWVENSLYMSRNGSQIHVKTENKDDAAGEFLIVTEEVSGGGIVLRYGGSATGDRRSDGSRAVVVHALRVLFSEGQLTVSVKLVEERTGRGRESVRKQLRGLAEQGMIAALPPGEKNEELYDISLLWPTPRSTSLQLGPQAGGRCEEIEGVPVPNTKDLLS